MAQSTDDLADFLKAILPEEYHADSSLIRGIAKGLNKVEIDVDTLVAQSKLDTASDSVLTLRAKGHGMPRASGESDPALRERLKTFGGAVIPASICDVVLPILQTVDAGATCTLREHWTDGPDNGEGAWIDQAFVGQNRIFSIPDGFTVEISGAGLPASLDDPIYNSAVNAVERVRPHSARWFLLKVT